MCVSSRDDYLEKEASGKNRTERTPAAARETKMAVRRMGNCMVGVWEGGGWIVNVDSLGFVLVSSFRWY